MHILFKILSQRGNCLLNFLSSVRMYHTTSSVYVLYDVVISLFLHLLEYLPSHLFIGEMSFRYCGYSCL